MTPIVKGGKLPYQYNQTTINALKSVLGIKDFELEFAGYIPGVNLFDKTNSDIQIGKYISYLTGVVNSSASYNLSYYIPVSENTNYVNNIGVMQTVGYDIDKVMVRGWNAKTFNTGANVRFIRISINVTTGITLDTFQFERGTVSTSFQDYAPLRIDSVIGYVMPNRIAMPSKQYLLGGYENTIYFQAICERWLPNNFFLQIENGNFINRSKFARLSNPVSASGVTANLYNINFAIDDSKTFEIVVGEQVTDNGALIIHVLGDSFTDHVDYYKKAYDLCPSLSFVGTREPIDAGATGIMSEGRGGWTLDKYTNPVITHSIDGLSDVSRYIQPIDPYKYFGDTLFWKNVVNGNESYEVRGNLPKATEIGFSETTGYKTTPAANDVMWSTENERYEVWNGSAWVEISVVTLGFTFNFAKYRAVWNIAQPSIMSILLGLNDFRTQTIENVVAMFPAWKTKMEALINSVHADSPNCKIAILIPTSVCGGVSDLIDSSSFLAKLNASMWNARKLIIDNFDNREDEKIYLVDTGSALDPVYGLALGSEEKPFYDFYGTERIKLQSNAPHPSTSGYYQIGIRLAGFIQAVR